MPKPYFTIHSIKALDNKNYSIVRANITNTEEHLKLAKELYPDNEYHFEYHDFKFNVKPLINQY